MNTFYATDISFPIYCLNKEESKHAVRVLRLKTGDKLQLIDGKGGWYLAEITDANPKRCEIQIVEKKDNFNKRNYYLHLAVAPPKNINRYEWFIEKATEIGVDEITPIICEHSERRNINIERLEKVMIAAMKQSVTAFCPKLNTAISLNEFLLNPFNGNKFIGFSPFIEDINSTEIKVFYHVLVRNTNVLMLIGPEGDFSLKEQELALQKGFQPISLGNNRFRTETAAIASCYAVNMLNT